ncbi:hypothetical protein MTR67_030802 [Solanum verrucosum]|uniref:Uncharacterized protein n=1 Tax=Solanum verrucosum TaxID=315347 RepID=A0AAF0U1A3_SOLVR|nr:hypothetical protein MTR67_030802 [Solanum verrucosum]
MGLTIRLIILRGQQSGGDDSALMTWAQFSEAFLRKYETRFHELETRAALLMSTEHERGTQGGPHVGRSGGRVGRNNILSHDRHINIGIDVELNMQPISVLPYRMALAELRELKEKLQDLLAKGFIRPVVSP